MEEREVIDSLIKKIARLEIELLKKERMISRLKGRRIDDKVLEKEIREKVDTLRFLGKGKRLKVIKKEGGNEGEGWK